MNSNEDKGNIVEVYRSGNTTIKVNDAYCAKGDQEIALILKKLHDAGWAIVKSHVAGKF